MLPVHVGVEIVVGGQAAVPVRDPGVNVRSREITGNLPARLAYLLPLLAMLLSDLVLGCTRYRMLSLIGIQPVVYACILATTALGHLIQDRRSVLQVGAASLAGSILFFVVTNYAVWAMGHGYPLPGSSLAECYVAAVPTYVGGHMAMGFASNNKRLRRHPMKTIAQRYRKAGNFTTQYWTPDVHVAAFAQPRFIADVVAKAKAQDRAAR